MPVDQKTLLSDRQRQVRSLEADLNAQAEADADLAARLRAEYALARQSAEQAFIAANPALQERHWFLHVIRVSAIA